MKAKCYPGVSAEDCLFVDLGVDPSRQGCQTFEATHLLLRDRPIATDCHVVLFQVGSVGDLGFNFTGFTNTNFGVLVDRLLKDYGLEHEPVHYVAALLSIARPTIERYRIDQLKQPEIEKRITGHLDVLDSSQSGKAGFKQSSRFAWYQAFVNQTNVYWSVFDGQALHRARVGLCEGPE